MPLAVVSTNLTTDRIPRDFMQKLSDELQRLFECNQALCMVEVRAGAMLMRAGDADLPAVNVELHHSHDKVNDVTKRQFGRVIADFLIDQLNVDLERILVLFLDTRCTTKRHPTVETEERMTTTL